MLPQFVSSDVLKFWCNAWCTKRRFGDKVSHCPFCKADTDDIFHFVHCPTIRVLRIEILLGASNDINGMQFCCMDAVESSELVTQASFLSALRMGHNDQRIHGGSIDDVRSVMRARLKMIRTKTVTVRN